jgi:hypothetical protein
VGLWPAGIGQPAPYVAPGGSVFRNVDNASPNAQLDARKIDPVTRQYDFDANGRVVGQTTTQQLVLLAFSTVAGTSAMTTLGQTLRRIQVIGPDIVRQVTTILTAAVQPYIDQKLLAILSISVVGRTGNGPGGLPTGGIVASVRWRDLVKNTDQTTTQSL